MIEALASGLLYCLRLPVRYCYFMQGWLARDDGSTMADCPHARGTRRRDYWAEGWFTKDRST